MEETNLGAVAELQSRIVFFHQYYLLSSLCLSGSRELSLCKKVKASMYLCINVFAATKRILSTFKSFQSSWKLCEVKA